MGFFPYLSYLIFIFVGLFFRVIETKEYVLEVGGFTFKASGFAMSALNNLIVFGLKNLHAAVMSKGRHFVVVKSRLRIEKVRIHLAGLLHVTEKIRMDKDRL